MHFNIATFIEFECAKCHDKFIGTPLAFEGFMEQWFAHIENDHASVWPVCCDCFQNHFAKYEQTTDPKSPVP